MTTNQDKPVDHAATPPASTASSAPANTPASVLSFPALNRRHAPAPLRLDPFVAALRSQTDLAFTATFDVLVAETKRRGLGQLIRDANDELNLEQMPAAALAEHAAALDATLAKGGVA